MWGCFCGRLAGAGEMSIFVIQKILHTMVIRERLIQLAFEFRETRLWEVLADNDIFAVQLQSGEIGYCSVMGQAGEHYGLGLYVGSGWNSYLNFARLADCTRRVEMGQIIAQIDCFNCDFSPAGLIQPSEQKDEIKAYAKAHGLKSTRGVGLPDFVRYSPNMVPGPYASESDMDAMEEALSAAIFVAKRLAKLKAFPVMGFTMDGIHPSDSPGQDIPLLSPLGRGSFELSKTILPGRTPDTASEVSFDRPELTVQISMLPMRSNLECRFITVDVASVAEPGKRPYFPTLMLSVDGNTGFVTLPRIEGAYDETTPAKSVEDLALHIIGSGTRPGTIFVEDDTTQLMLKDFCSRTGIKLQRVSRLKHLEEAWTSLAQALGRR